MAGLHTKRGGCGPRGIEINVESPQEPNVCLVQNCKLTSLVLCFCRSFKTVSHRDKYIYINRGVGGDARRDVPKNSAVHLRSPDKTQKSGQRLCLLDLNSDCHYIIRSAIYRDTRANLIFLLRPLTGNSCQVSAIRAFVPSVTYPATTSF